MPASGLVSSVKIIGISAYYHDSAAVLLANGEIIAAAQEERFSRKKHDPRFPVEAMLASEFWCQMGKSGKNQDTKNTGKTVN